MNQKKAKLLRKLIGFSPKAERTYQDKVVKTVYVPTETLDAQGNAIMLPQQRVQRTCSSVNQYRRMKRGYNTLTEMIKSLVGK